MDQLPRLGKRELICLLLFTCNYVVSVWRGSLFLWVLGMGYVILLWHSLSLPYNYFILTFKRLEKGILSRRVRFKKKLLICSFKHAVVEYQYSPVESTQLQYNIYWTNG